jgi:hypothetical protein
MLIMMCGLVRVADRRHRSMRIAIAVALSAVLMLAGCVSERTAGSRRSPSQKGGNGHARWYLIKIVEKPEPDYPRIGIQLQALPVYGRVESGEIDARMTEPLRPGIGKEVDLTLRYSGKKVVKKAKTNDRGYVTFDLSDEIQSSFIDVLNGALRMRIDCPNLTCGGMDYAVDERQLQRICEELGQ